MTTYQTALKVTTGPRYSAPSHESTTKTALVFDIKAARDTRANITGPVIVNEPVSSSDHAIDLKNRFRQLADQWSGDTINMSSLTEMVSHPAYLRIIGLGAPATRLLLQELETNPDYWFFALSAVTNQDPATDDDRGDFERTRRKWLQWGKVRHYI